jgi:hypothetical protein
LCRRSACLRRRAACRRGANGDTAPSANGSPSDSGAATYGGGGGGGSSGFITLHARTGSNVMIAFGAIISPAPTTGAVTAQ